MADWCLCPHGCPDVLIPRHSGTGGWGRPVLRGAARACGPARDDHGGRDHRPARSVELHGPLAPRLDARPLRGLRPYHGTPAVRLCMAESGVTGITGILFF